MSCCDGNKSWTSREDWWKLKVLDRIPIIFGPKVIGIRSFKNFVKQGSLLERCMSKFSNDKVKGDSQCLTMNTNRLKKTIVLMKFVIERFEKLFARDHCATVCSLVANSYQKLWSLLERSFWFISSSIVAWRVRGDVKHSLSSIFVV